MGTPRKGHSRKPIAMTEDACLEALKAGKSVAAICREHNYANTGEFYRMKKRNPTFAAKVDAIQSAPQAQRNAAEAAAKPLPDSALSWQEQYMISYRQYHDRVRAADASGKTVIEVLEALDPVHENYDPEFALLYKEETVREALYVEDAVIKRAVVEGDFNAQKLILPTLPYVGEKYSVRKGKIQENESGNNFFFFAEPKALDGARAVMKRLYGETETIDVEVTG